MLYHLLDELLPSCLHIQGTIDLLNATAEAKTDVIPGLPRRRRERTEPISRANCARSPEPSNARIPCPCRWMISPQLEAGRERPWKLVMHREETQDELDNMGCPA